MKKLKLLVLLLCLLFPLKGFAKDIGLELTSIQFKEKTGTALEVEEATIDNNTINLYVKFLEEGDSITYKLNVKNTDSESYRLGLTSNDDYLLYEISNEEINPDTTTTVLIKVTYNTTPAEGIITENQKVTINIKDKDNNIIQLTNPKTNPNTIAMIITLLIITAVVIIGIKSKNKKKIIPLVLTLFLIPTIVYATITQELSMEVTYKINNSTGLRYKDKLLYLFEEDEEYNSFNRILDRDLDNQFEQENSYIESFCPDDPDDIDTEMNTNSRITYTVIDVNSTDVIYMIDSGNDLYVLSSAEIITEEETGDSMIRVGSCSLNPNLDSSHFMYNGNSTNIDLPISNWIDYVICPRLREVFESLDTECFKKIIDYSSEDNSLS